MKSFDRLYLKLDNKGFFMNPQKPKFILINFTILKLNTVRNKPIAALAVKAQPWLKFKTPLRCQEPGWIGKET